MDRIERIKLLKRASNDVRFQGILWEKCNRDIVFWFNTFGWTVNPREDTALLPFELYPVQEWIVQEIYGSIENQVDWGIEKSRDIGASWMVMEIFQYCWIFRPGWDLGVGSRKESEVDKNDDDHSTLFGKFRINWKLLPAWMRPPVTRHTDRFLSIRNEWNGNIITGESANPNFMRGPRKRSIYLDEFAFWTAAQGAWKSCSQTTNSRGVASTPDGSNNKYAELMLDKKNTVLQWPGLQAEMKRKGLIH